jgi:hypothetical protein
MVAGRAALDKMHELGPIAMNTVSETSPAAWLVDQNKSLPPYGIHASNDGPINVMFPSIDESLGELLVKYTLALPLNPATLWVWHCLHGAAMKPKLDSCFAFRERHFMIEIIGISTEEANAEVSGQWADAFHDDARQLGGAFGGGYIAMNPRLIPSYRCYPGHWKRLQALKADLDPRNKFCYSLAGLDGGSSPVVDQ